MGAQQPWEGLVVHRCARARILGKRFRLIATLALGLLVSAPASAGTAVFDAVWSNGLSTINAQPGDLLTLTVRLAPGTQGVSNYAISVDFDPLQLDLVSAVNVPAPGALISGPLTNLSDPVGSFNSAFGLTPAVANFSTTPFVIGTIQFNTIALGGFGPTNVVPGLFNPGDACVSPAGGCSSYLPAIVNIVPEPTSGALVFVGLAAQALRRRLLR